MNIKMESRFANSFFSSTSTNNNVNHRKGSENKFEDSQQNKRPKLDICLPKTLFKDTSKYESHESVIETESFWEDLDEKAVAECIERASQAIPMDPQVPNTNPKKCDIDKSGLLTKPIVRSTPNAVCKYPPVVRHNSPQTISKEQMLKKNLISKAASTGNLKNSSNASTTSASSCSSSSGISLFTNNSFSPQVRAASRNPFEDQKSQTGTNSAIHSEKCKSCETMSTQLRTLTDKIQTKDGEISLLRSHLDEVRAKSLKGKDDLSILRRELDEKKRLLEKTISDQNTVINFITGELQSKSQTCDRLKSSLKQRSSHSPFPVTCSSRSPNSHSTESSQQKEMSFTPAMLSHLAKHDGRFLFDISSADITESQKLVSFLDDSDQAVKDNSWFVSILFEFQKHQSFCTESAEVSLNKLVSVCISSLEEICRIKETSAIQSQRIKELYNKHHDIAPLSKTYRLLSAKPWYSEESGIKQRRLLHLISRIIEIEPKLARVLVPSDKSELKIPRSSNSERSLLHVLKNTLKLIRDECYSLDLNGLLASSASLINSILKTKIDINEEGQTVINDIFRMILLCCPGPTVMLYSCKFLLAVDDKYTYITNSLCKNTPAKEHLDSERSNTFDEGTCTITLICYLVFSMKNGPKIYQITDVLVRWLRILQTKWNKSSFPPWLNWGSLAQLPSGYKPLCDCRFELNKLILRLLYEAAELFSNENHTMTHEERRSLEMVLDRGIAFIFAIAIGEDRSLSIEAGEIEGHYELFVHILSACSNLNVSAIQQKNLKHLALQEIKEPLRRDSLDDDNDDTKELFQKLCTF